MLSNFNYVFNIINYHVVTLINLSYYTLINIFIFFRSNNNACALLRDNEIVMCDLLENSKLVAKFPLFIGTFVKYDAQYHRHVLRPV